MIRVTEEPKGGTYRSLLSFASTRSAYFSLVWRTDSPFGAQAAAIELLLRPHLATEVLATEWPGTQLLGGTAMVRRYAVSDASIRVLEAPGRLFGWRAPEFPEDLAFYSSSGSCWLGSISHEADAWLTDPATSIPDLLEAVPGLRLVTE
jgi:hypothetical protein